MTGADLRYDAVVVGGGPAGLSAALLLGRCRRTVLLLDSEAYRNAAATHLHGFLSRDDIAPRLLRQMGRADLERYETVEALNEAVRSVARADDGFAVALSERTVRARTLLLATGVADELPEVPGFMKIYGTSAFHCPYCDGWEVRDAPLAIYGRTDAAHGLALELTRWSRDLVLCTDGSSALTEEHRTRLATHGIALREEAIARLESTDGVLQRIVFREGPALERRALFFSTSQRQASPLAQSLGCTLSPDGDIVADRHEATGVPGLYAAGDASSGPQLAIVAAAEGAKAAFAMNTALLKQDLLAVEGR